MSYRVDKVGDSYKLYNLSKKTYVNKKYKSKEAAMNAGRNFGRYRNENLKPKGNKLVKAKKKPKSNYGY